MAWRSNKRWMREPPETKSTRTARVICVGRKVDQRATGAAFEAAGFEVILWNGDDGGCGFAPLEYDVPARRFSVQPGRGARSTIRGGEDRAG